MDTTCAILLVYRRWLFRALPGDFSSATKCDADGILTLVCVRVVKCDMSVLIFGDDDIIDTSNEVFNFLRREFRLVAH